MLEEMAGEAANVGESGDRCEAAGSNGERHGKNMRRAYVEKKGNSLRGKQTAYAP